jgi:hypothetical protein
MKSLQGEFRRDSVRLEEIRPSFSNCLVLLSGGAATRDKNVAMGQLIFTMDVFTFNLVLNALDTFYQHKGMPFGLNGGLTVK